MTSTKYIVLSTLLGNSGNLFSLLLRTWFSFKTTGESENGMIRKPIKHTKKQQQLHPGKGGECMAEVNRCDAAWQTRNSVNVIVNQTNGAGPKKPIILWISLPFGNQKKKEEERKKCSKSRENKRLEHRAHSAQGKWCAQTEKWNYRVAFIEVNKRVSVGEGEGCWGRDRVLALSYHKRLNQKEKKMKGRKTKRRRKSDRRRK